VLPELNHQEIHLIEKLMLCFCLSGTQSIYIKTWGCSHNNSDSEYMAGQLAAYGYIITGSTGNYVCAMLQYIVCNMLSFLDTCT